MSEELRSEQVSDQVPDRVVSRVPGRATGRATSRATSRAQDEATPQSPAQPQHLPDELLTVGEMSRRTGVAVSALHYYEELGLIASRRTAGNQRRYPRYMLRRVALVAVAKRLGIPLADVQESFADVPLETTPSHEEWQRASRRWKKTLELRRQGIEQLERELTGCIGCGCLSMKACTLLNPDDELGDSGSGARRIRV